jgi:hypothetical protein
MGEEQLLLVVEALSSLRLFFGLGQRGQQDAGEYSDNGDHHQELNQRESQLLCWAPP